MKFKKGDLIYYTRTTGRDRHSLTRGILTYLVVDAYKTKNGRSREYKLCALHDEAEQVERGRIVYLTKDFEVLYRLEKC